jgi:hypothetical protein
MFLWTGLVTAAFGVVLFFVMPDNPLKARFLTPRERILAIERIRMNQQGVGNKHFKKYQFLEALKDPLVFRMKMFLTPGLVLFFLCSDCGYSEWRNNEFLFPLDSRIWLYYRTISALRCSWWRSGSRYNYFLPILRRFP